MRKILEFNQLVFENFELGLLWLKISGSNWPVMVLTSDLRKREPLWHIINGINSIRESKSLTNFSFRFDWFNSGLNVARSACRFPDWSPKSYKQTVALHIDFKIGALIHICRISLFSSLFTLSISLCVFLSLQQTKQVSPLFFSFFVLLLLLSRCPNSAYFFSWFSLSTPSVNRLVPPLLYSVLLFPASFDSILFHFSLLISLSSSSVMLFFFFFVVGFCFCIFKPRPACNLYFYGNLLF